MPATAVLLGDTAVEWQHDLLAAGQAEAFRVRAGTSGLTGAVHVYIGVRNEARTLIAGLYTSAEGHPGTLLSMGSTPAVGAGTWTAVPIAPVELVQGRSYWLAILGEGGRLRYRDRARGPCPSETSASHDLRTLPSPWRTGTTYSDCPPSAFVTATSLAAPAEGGRLPSVLTEVPVVALTPSVPPQTPPPQQPPPPPPPPPLPKNTAPPTISGVAEEDQTLHTSTGTWTENPTSYEYQWEKCNTAGESCAEIAGATSAGYKLLAGDVGHTIRVTVTASNAGGSTSASSAATVKVTKASSPPPPPPKNTALPVISGTAEEGQTLHANTGTWTENPTFYEYQWEDCNTMGESCSKVAGATSASHKLLASDVGHTVRVTVTASNAGGSTSASSAATVKVTKASSPPPPPPKNTALPVISGTAEEGQTLHASTGTWTENPTFYEYQWEECDTVGESCLEVAGATSASYKLLASDVGHTMRVVVSASNAGGSTSASSTATEEVTEVPPPPPPPPPKNTALPTISGATEEGQTLRASTGTWTENPTSYEYQWEDCNAVGESCADVAGATSASHKLLASDVGHTVRVTVTASNAGGSGEASSAATETVVARQAAGPQIYVAQAGAGDESGESCADARSLAWLNAGGNWGTGAGKVEPGVTVDLCGVFTAPVETRGSGSSGKPITIHFTTGAKIAIGDEGCPGSGCINVAGGSEYITIDGGEGGTIENTDTGTGKDSPAATTGVEADGCKHCTIEDLTIANLYVPKKGTEYGDTENRGIYIQGETPEYVTISHDTFTNMGWAVNVEMGETSSHITVEDDTFHVVTHGFTPTADFSGGDIGPVIFAHNYFYGNLEWEDGSVDTNHVDGVHCYSANARGYTPHYTGLYIYDNYIEVEGNNVTAPIFLEGGSGEGRTPCADKASSIWVFNNVLWNASQTVEGGNGLLGVFSGEPRIYNNTLIGEAATSNICEEFNSVTEEIRYKNNLTSSCKTLVDAEKARFDTSEMADNLWANGGDTGEALICENPARNAYSLSDFSGWKGCMGGSGVEEGSKSAASAKVEFTDDKGSEGKPEAGSPTVGTGANLTSLCGQTPEEALCQTINGTARPGAGAWDIGAY